MNCWEKYVGAYALANGAISDYSAAMQNSIDEMTENMQMRAQQTIREQDVIYGKALVMSTVFIVISVAFDHAKFH